MEYYLITFHSTHAAIGTQKYLTGEGEKIMIMPTLREISASCGISIRVNPQDFTSVLKKMPPPGMEENSFQYYHIQNTRIEKI